ncbi:MAG: hypothetical protein WCF84_11445 [Anaerolineae bacterium]
MIQRTLPTPHALWVLFAAVIANYLAQIPYDLHLYGFSFNPRGVLLLGSTLVWFLVGFGLLVSRHALGYWLTLAFIAVQVVFYFNNEIILMFYGYGLLYHLTTFKDPIIWATEFIGDVNFVAAVYFLYYFLRYKSRLLAQM